MCERDRKKEWSINGIGEAEAVEKAVIMERKLSSERIRNVWNEQKKRNRQCTEGEVKKSERSKKRSGRSQLPQSYHHKELSATAG